MSKAHADTVAWVSRYNAGQQVGDKLRHVVLARDLSRQLVRLAVVGVDNYSQAEPMTASFGALNLLIERYYWDVVGFAEAPEADLEAEQPAWMADLQRRQRNGGAA